MSELPAPLIGPEVDLRDFDSMPLFGERLFASDTWITCDAEEKVAALRLWWKSWHQEPAGSLPNEDRLLSDLAGYGVALKAWTAVRPKAMRGWILCSDGRLYHPIVCEIAATSWAKKNRKRADNERDRVRKQHKRGSRPAGNAPLSTGQPDGVPPGQQPPAHVVSAGIPPGKALNEKGREEKGRDSSASGFQDAAGEPALEVIAAFDAERIAAFGEAQGRPWPVQSDLAVARRWLAEGVDLTLCRSVFAARFRAQQAGGKPPSDTLEHMTHAVANALATAAQPMPKGTPQTYVRNGAKPRELSEQEKREKLEEWGMTRAPTSQVRAKIRAEGLAECWTLHG